MQQKVGVRFKINPKVSYYNSNIELKRGDYVIVESDLGSSFGVVDNVIFVDDEVPNLKKVIKKADENDVKQNEINIEKEKKAIEITKNLCVKLNLNNMEIVNAEYSFDGAKVIINFISEDRVDFRELVKELASSLKTRIELCQIGTRDQARMVGGIGICGRICCCAAHLKDFEKVSIKMAKVQGLSLNPTKISGSCGRLMCCLDYENEYYSEIYPKIPKINAFVKTPDGDGVVVYTNALKQLVSVKIEQKDGSTIIKDFSIDNVSTKERHSESSQKKDCNQQNQNNKNNNNQNKNNKK